MNDGPEQRTADLEEQLARAEHRLEERTQNADESRDDVALEDGSYCEYWLNRVMQ